MIRGCDLSKTLLRIAKYWYLEFYQGLTADYIIKCMDHYVIPEDTVELIQTILRYRAYYTQKRNKNLKGKSSITV